MGIFICLCAIEIYYVLLQNKFNAINMNGINFVTTEDGVRNAVLIDFNILRQQRTAGKAVVNYLASLEDIEDIVDVELSRTEASDDWNDVKLQLQNEGKLSAYV
jgi:hypothetical protein